MTLYNTGTFVVQSGASTSTQTDAFGAMKSAAAKVIGGENQAYYLTMAGEGLLKAIDIVNMNSILRFGSAQGSDANLVLDTADYSLPAGVFAIQAVQLIGTDGKVHAKLDYVPWGQYNNVEQKQTSTGVPEFWTARNSFDDQSIEVYPVPDADAVSKYDLRVSYYERVARPTLDTDVIDAPRELSEILVTYAEYYILRLRSKSNPTVYFERKRAFDEQLAQFIESTEREPSDGFTWTMGPFAGAPGRRYDPLS